MFLYLLLSLCLGPVRGANIKGPPRATQQSVFQLGRLGEEVKLTCPMEGNPAPFIQWFRNEEAIDFQWTRFRTNKKFLKIREAELADSGRYVCRGINGFGKEQIAVDLLVIDPADFPDLAEGELPDFVPPSLSADTATARDQYEKRPGEVLTLACSASGKPRPHIVWQHDGNLLENVGEESTTANGGTTMTTSLLRLRGLRAQDAGTYSCLARNVAGHTGKDFTLSVARQSLIENPVFFGSGQATTSNKTVRVGETATFDCRVQSGGGYPPAIKWLKRLEPREILSMSSAMEVITVGEDRYRLIDSSNSEQQQLVGEGGVQQQQYVSQLELVNVGMADAGMYICFVTNIMGGFNYKPAFLTVLNNTETVFESPLVLAISISLAILTLLILSLLLGCLVRNRRGAKKPQEAPESAEVHHTLICPPPTAASAQEPVYTQKVGQPLPPPPAPTPVQWSLLYGGQPAAPTAYTDSSHYEGNTYEVPRTHNIGGGVGVDQQLYTRSHHALPSHSSPGYGSSQHSYAGGRQAGHSPGYSSYGGSGGAYRHAEIY